MKIAPTKAEQEGHHTMMRPCPSTSSTTAFMLVDANPADAELPEVDTVIPPLHFEPVGGLYQWDGLHHVAGQNAIAAARPYYD